MPKLLLANSGGPPPLFSPPPFTQASYPQLFTHCFSSTPLIHSPSHAALFDGSICYTMSGEWWWCEAAATTPINIYISIYIIIYIPININIYIRFQLETVCFCSLTVWFLFGYRLVIVWFQFGFSCWTSGFILPNQWFFFVSPNWTAGFESK